MESNPKKNLSADEVLGLLSDGNQRFVDNQPTPKDFAAQRARLAQGQFPFAALVSCIDSRIAAEVIFDLDLGQIFHARMAGACATRDLIAGLEYAAVSGVKLVMVLGHTQCGAVHAAVTRRNGEPGISENLDGLLERIAPAIEGVGDFPGEKSASNSSFVDVVARANVLETIAVIRRSSPLLASREDEGLRIQGAMYDLASGAVEFLSDP